MFGTFQPTLPVTFTSEMYAPGFTSAANRAEVSVDAVDRVGRRAGKRQEGRREWERRESGGRSCNGPAQEFQRVPCRSSEREVR